MLLTAVNVAVTVREDFINGPWSCVMLEGHEVVDRDLKKAYGVVVRRRVARDTCEKWFEANSVEASVVGRSFGNHGVRMSNIVEVRVVENWPDSVLAPDTPSITFGAKRPLKAKRKKNSTPVPTAAPQHFLKFEDESVVLPKGRCVYFVDGILKSH